MSQLNVLDAPCKKTFIYVPISSVLPVMLNRDDILDKILQEKTCTESQSGHYKTFSDKSYFKENPLLSGEELCISLGLYIDDFEICNPLGTLRKKRRVCAIYWVMANLPVRYRSSLSSIYLAILCNSNNLKTFGYDRIVEPLLKDLYLLENQGFYVHRLGTNVGGTVLDVSSDNLGAHYFAGIQESFNIDKFCHFCLASHGDIQTVSVISGAFTLRTKASYNEGVAELKENENLTNVDGVKRVCFKQINLFPCNNRISP